jgi:ATP-dependent exoDNAse (exonuclease V) alpha subunit
MSTTAISTLPSTSLLPTPKSAKHLPFEASPEQITALALLEQFIAQDARDTFILSGQAGTGKTSLIPALLKHIREQKLFYEIAAPTGRAAQVISAKCEEMASTIHSLIYYPIVDEEKATITFVRKPNPSSQKTIYIIDESSMVSGMMQKATLFSARKPLLNDLIDFVKSGHSGNKIIFVGDPYQLPPVGEDDSPALDPAFLKNRLNLRITSFELKEVKRQAEQSPILAYATSLRMAMQGQAHSVRAPFHLYTKPWYFIDGYLRNYRPQNLNNVISICMSNKAVVVTNEQVRRSLWGKNVEKMPLAGDAVIVNSNWYNQLFTVNNGTMGIITRINYEKMREVAGLHFVPCSVQFNIGNRTIEIETLMLLDVMLSENPDLTIEQEKLLFAHAMRTNKNFRESKLPWADPYLGAIRLRYGYALTCHKAQGGEWKNVFLNPYYSPTNYRWLYTACTRAVDQIYSFTLNA